MTHEVLREVPDPLLSRKEKLLETIENADLETGINAPGGVKTQAAPKVYAIVYKEGTAQGFFKNMVNVLEVISLLFSLRLRGEDVHVQTTPAKRP